MLILAQNLSQFEIFASREFYGEISESGFLSDSGKLRETARREVGKVQDKYLSNVKDFFILIQQIKTKNI